GSSWTIATSPDLGALPSGFNGITALAPTNIWAVGIQQEGYDPSTGNSSTGLIEHWNGSSWMTVPHPNPRSNPQPIFNPNSEASDSGLNSVTALAPDNIWAVGSYMNLSGTGPLNNAYIEHWDGSGWKIVPSPNPGSLDNELLSVTALAPDNIWAVGDFMNN